MLFYSTGRPLKNWAYYLAEITSGKNKDFHYGSTNLRVVKGIFMTRDQHFFFPVKLLIFSL